MFYDLYTPSAMIHYNPAVLAQIEGMEVQDWSFRPKVQLGGSRDVFVVLALDSERIIGCFNDPARAIELARHHPGAIASRIRADFCFDPSFGMRAEDV